MDYVGFYWTFSARWARFTELPVDVAAAAAKSKTIRYQRALIEQWIDSPDGRKEGRRLIDEIVFLERSDDRPTAKISEALARAKPICSTKKATLIFVDFSAELNRRRHNFLLDYLKDSGFPQQQELWPKPVDIGPDANERNFDPAKHFTKWRKASQQAHADQRKLAKTALEAAAEKHPNKRGRYRAIAAALNSGVIKTANGNAWTEDSTRRQMARWGID